MSDRTDDCEGELLAMARSIVGDRAAIGCLLDLHANLSQRMLEAADFVVSCREYPHIDYHERAVEMLPVLAAAARGEVEPTTAAVRFGGPGVYPTPDEPMRSFVRRFTEAQSRPGVLQVSVNHGFEGSDQPDLSAAVVVTTDGDVDLSERGRIEIQHAARLLLERGYFVDVIYTSRLKRAIRSTWILLKELNQIYKKVYKTFS
jgi:microcystin degradation protein MlrC